MKVSKGRDRERTIKSDFTRNRTILVVGKIERKRIIERPVTRKRTKLVLKKIERKRMIGGKVTRNITKLVLKKTGGGKRDCHMERILKSFTMHKTSQCKSLQFR